MDACIGARRAPPASCSVCRSPRRLGAFASAYLVPQLLAAVLARLGARLAAGGLAAAGLFEPALAVPERFDCAIVFSRAMSRRTSRTRAVFSNCPLARWKRRLKCSFLSLS